MPGLLLFAGNLAAACLWELGSTSGDEKGSRGSQDFSHTVFLCISLSGLFLRKAFKSFIKLYWSPTMCQGLLCIRMQEQTQRGSCLCVSQKAPGSSLECSALPSTAALLSLHLPGSNAPGSTWEFGVRAFPSPRNVMGAFSFLRIYENETFVVC